MTYLKKIKYNICNFIGIVLTIINLKIILKKLLSLDLAKTQVFWTNILMNVIIIYYNKNLVFTTLQAIGLGFETLNNS